MNMGTKRARVVVAHHAPEHAPIRVAKGDTVTLGERDIDWPDFVWTTLAQGIGGWIPSTLFDRESGEAVAQDDYDTRELDTEVGEILTLHREQAAWWWAENARGEQGWVPARAIEFIEENPA
ncbi:MAG TPA: SH3 domain-containing protein [Pseudoxanthomonas sp.]|nr:SH3 domain-containing protein [Pseudoxanthomonas sp.]